MLPDLPLPVYADRRQNFEQAYRWSCCIGSTAPSTGGIRGGRRAAVSDLYPDSATVLVFIDQTTTMSEKPDPAMTAGSVRLTLTEAEES